MGIVVSLKKKMFTLKIDDGICKGFKDEDGLDIFVNKAVDEDTGAHCLLVYIPSIPELNANVIQYPIGFESESQRDDVYTNGITDEFVTKFYEDLYSHIKQNAELKESNSDIPNS